MKHRTAVYVLQNHKNSQQEWPNKSLMMMETGMKSSGVQSQALSSQKTDELYFAQCNLQTLDDTFLLFLPIEPPPCPVPRMSKVQLMSRTFLEKCHWDPLWERQVWPLHTPLKALICVHWNENEVSKTFFWASHQWYQTRKITQISRHHEEGIKIGKPVELQQQWS